jgi:hypothetical protein
MKLEDAIEEVEYEVRKDPEEVIMIVLAHGFIFLGLVFNSMPLVYISFFLLIMTGVEIIEKRLDRIIEGGEKE